MPQITVRLSDEEHRQLVRGARRRRMKKSAYLRALVREQPLDTAADWVKWADQHEGRQWLRER